jgi:hypothetical protein
MSTRRREFAKFFAGFAACETFGHWWFGIWARDLLPIKLKWFTFTPELNWFAMAFWPVALTALVYYAWLRKPRVSDGPIPTALRGA